MGGRRHVRNRIGGRRRSSWWGCVRPRQVGGSEACGSMGGPGKWEEVKHVGVEWRDDMSPDVPVISPHSTPCSLDHPKLFDQPHY